MKVLHLTNHYPPALGGIEAHVANLAIRQAARGDDVTVLTSTPPTADGHRADDTGDVRVRRAASLLDGLDFDFGAFDLVHAHLSVVAPFAAPLAAVAARRGVPTIVTVHSLWNGLGPIPGLAVELAGLRRAPVTWTAVSRVAAAQVRAQLPRATPVGVLPNAVSVAPRGHTPPTDGGPVRLVSTMRIARRKRPLTLLRMVRALALDLRLPVRLTVIGDGPLRRRFEQAAGRTGLRDFVSVTGRVEASEVYGLLSRADVYVAPALLESFGLAALEARCVGLPVVGHAESGMTDFLRDGVEGALCRSDVEMTQRLAELVVDGPLRRQISEHNRSVPSPMTWANTMTAHDAAYQRVASTVLEGVDR
ncbi:MAG: glycosyltransferase family 4 protein [Nocardioidaceae bacterium]